MDEKKNQPVGDKAEQIEASATPADSEMIENEPDPLGLDPTRFGDWEKNGRCIDF